MLIMASVYRLRLHERLRLVTRHLPDLTNAHGTRVPLNAFLSLLTVACGSSSGYAQRAERTDSSGVELVANTPDDRRLDWRFQPLWSVGGSVAGQVMLTNLSARQIVSDSSGQLYVLDSAAKHVLVLANNGTVVDTLGREGEGPGELRDPFAITLGEDGGVAVFDFGRGGFVHWSRNGEPQGFRKVRMLPWRRKLINTVAGMLYVSRSPAGSSMHLEELVLQAAEGSDIVASMLTLPHRVADFPTCNLRHVTVPQLFAPELEWDAQGDRLAVVDGVAYVIDIYRLRGDVRQIRSVRRPMPPQELDEDTARRAVEDGWTVGSCTVPPAEVVQGRGFAEVMPIVESIAYSPRGELWVLRGRVGDEPARIDVFGSDGEYLGTLPSGVRFPSAFLREDQIVTIENDRFDVPRISAYRIIR